MLFRSISNEVLSRIEHNVGIYSGRGGNIKILRSFKIK